MLPVTVSAMSVTTCFWCTWFLLVRGMMCQAVCLNLLSVKLLLQSIQRKWPAKDFLAS